MTKLQLTGFSNELKIMITTAILFTVPDKCFEMNQKISDHGKARRTVMYSCSGHK